MHFQKGQIWLIRATREREGIRPALIISSDDVHRVDNACLVLPIYKTTSDIEATDLQITKEESGMPDDCVIRCAKISTIGFASFQGCLGTLSAETMSRIDMELQIACGIGKQTDFPDMNKS